ncbi:MAG: DUF2029 domain-containing protein [Deltaproteobacteria bacterium]|nr:DUF2029 domain-containing protein [Deltaproteobacteria bacterium]
MSHAEAYSAYAFVVALAVMLARRYPEGPRSRRERMIALLAAGAGAALVTGATDTPWFGDYESAYYPAGKLIFAAPALLYGGECAFGFVNLPLVAVPFVPFSLFPYRVAVALFTAVGLWAIVACARSLASWSDATRGSVGPIFALFIANGPLWYSVREGNSTHIVLLLLIGALYALRDGKELRAGGLLGLAATVKLPLVLFVFYLAARMRFRAVLGFILAVVLLAVVSVLVHGFELHRLWAEQCLFPYAGKPVAGFNVQSLTGFLARLYGGDTYSWTPMAIRGSFKVVQHLLSAILALVVASVFIRGGKPRGPSQTAVEFSAFLSFILLFSPLSWTHYFLVLLIPMALLLSGDIPLPRGRAWPFAWLVTLLLCSLPLRGFKVDMAAFKFVADRVLASLHFFATLVLLGILLRVRLEQRAKPEDARNDAQRKENALSHR